MSLCLKSERRLTQRYLTLLIPAIESARITTQSHSPIPQQKRFITVDTIERYQSQISQYSQHNRPSSFTTSPSSASSLHQRHFHSSSTSMADQPQKKDWSATQYLKFGNERTRAVYDLLSQVAPHITSPSPRIYDLGKPSISNTYT